jgi:hypothetical protein
LITRYDLQKQLCTTRPKRFLAAANEDAVRSHSSLSRDTAGCGFLPGFAKGRSTMIYFFADNHYGARPGFHIYRELSLRYSIRFFEDDYSGLADPAFASSCELLILNCIAGTGTAPPPGGDAESAVKAYCMSAKPMLLLHGASAAFSLWAWWRQCTGFRWVRPNDPDGVSPSVHPVRPYRIAPAKCRHPLMGTLTPIELPRDEIYTRLEQVNPAVVLMHTTIKEGTFPMLYESATPWHGRVIGFLPGHRPKVCSSAAIVSTAALCVDYLLAAKR